MDDGAGHPVVPAAAAALNPSGGTSWSSATESLTKLAQTVGASLGVVTGVLVLFGATYTGAFYGYFGITHGVLQYSIQDQLVQSAQPLFGTAVILLALAVVLWVLDRMLTPLRRRTDVLGWWTRATLAAVGVLLGAAGLLTALGAAPVADVVPPRVGALALLAGALALLRARGTGPGGGERGQRFLLVMTSVLAVFWVTTVYAGEAGTGLARQVDERPGALAVVTVFSGEYLDLPGSAVVATQNASPGGEALYRYTGLRLLTYSQGRWFLVTGSDEGYRPTVTVLPDDPGRRVEVAREQDDD